MSDRDLPDDDDAVGYGRPPKHSRFKPGQSGNPKGRAKGSQNLANVLARELAERVTINENGRRRKVTKLVASVKQLVNSAASGNPRSMNLLVALARTEVADVATPLSTQADVEVQQALLRRLLGQTGREGNDAGGDDGPQ